jgi:hypothetical protein
MDGTALAWLLRVVSYGVVFLSSLAAMTLIMAAAPGLVDRERRSARSGMRRCFTWGLVFFLNAVLVAALLAIIDGLIGNVLALGVLVGLLVVSLAGLAAIASEVGHRVLLLAERSHSSELMRLFVGTIVLFAVAVIPIFGWLVFTGAILTGIGAFLEVAVDDYRPTRLPAPAPEADRIRA